MRSTNILLRPPEMDDFSAWVALRKASRTFLEPWEPAWLDDELTRTSFRYRLHVYNKLSDEDRGQALFVFNANQILVGAINLSNIRRGVAQMATLGYWVGAEFARQGLMTQALQLLIPYTQNDLKLHRLEAACLPHNAASISLLKRIGFAEEGFAKSYLKIAGHWQDHILFARLTSHNRESH